MKSQDKYNDADSFCANNRLTNQHKWSQCFKDKISKSAYFQILRCRYCLQYLLAQFERTTLPSGRVTITQTVGIIPRSQMEQLRSGYAEVSTNATATNGIENKHV